MISDTVLEKLASLHINLQLYKLRTIYIYMDKVGYFKTEECNFYVLLTVNLSIILVINQLNAQILVL